jgi:uncharacterized protein (TIGR02145 family)
MTTYHTSNPFRSFGSSLLLSYFSLLLPALHLSAQTAIGGSNPDPSAILDVQSTQKGVLFPRVPNNSSVPSPATGLMIFNNGNRCLEINLGTPASPSWQSINCDERCGAYIAPGEWKRFMCHNLGSADFSSDPFTPSWENNGGYWRWGANAEAAPGPTDASTPNDAAIVGWGSLPVGVNGAWLDASKTTADPCPDGYRVPTKTQWEGVIAHNGTPTNANGSPWTAGATNYSIGKNFGTSLMLPAAGYRDPSTGTLFLRGSFGIYWSSAEDGSVNAWNLFFFNGGDFVILYDRTYGLSVRCLAE